MAHLKGFRKSILIIILLNIASKYIPGKNAGYVY